MRTAAFVACLVLSLLAVACDGRSRVGELQALSSSDPSLRRAAVQFLGQTGDAAMRIPLIAAMQNDSSEPVRRRAAQSLGELGDRRATPALVMKMLGDDTRAVRSEAITALEQLKDMRALSGVIALWRVKASGSKWADVDTDILQERAARVVIALGPGAIPAMHTALTELNHNVRLGAVRSLAKLDPTRVRERISTLLHDPHPAVRAEVAFWLSSGKARPGGAAIP